MTLAAASTAKAEAEIARCHLRAPARSRLRPCTLSRIINSSATPLHTTTNTDASRCRRPRRRVTLLTAAASAAESRRLQRGRR